MDEKALNENIAKLEKALEEIKAKGNYCAGQLDLLRAIKAEQESQAKIASATEKIEALVEKEEAA